MVNFDRYDRERFVVSLLLSLLLNGVLWRAVATISFAPRADKSKYLEISRVRIPRAVENSGGLPPQAIPDTSLPKAEEIPPPRPSPQALPKGPIKKPVRKTGTKKETPPVERSPESKDGSPEQAAPAGPPANGEDDAFTTTYDVPAEALEQVKPEIPADLRSTELKSYVRVRVDVEATGSARPSLRTSSGNLQIDNLVLNALKKWKWKPATRNGEAVSSTLYFKFVFEVK